VKETIMCVLKDNRGIQTPEAVVVAAAAAAIGITVFGLIRSGIGIGASTITSKVSSIVGNAGTASGW